MRNDYYHYYYYQMLAYIWLILIGSISGVICRDLEHGRGSLEIDEISTTDTPTTSGSFITIETQSEDITEPYPATTPSDFDLNFESVTIPNDSEGTESLESTTSVSSSSSVVVKSGRHFETRVQSSSSRSTKSSIGNVNNIVVNQPALKPRPTTSVISFNPTNYNRILKRNKNVTNLIDPIVLRTQSSQEGFISQENMEFLPKTTTPYPTSTSQNVLFQRRRLMFALRTARPPTLNPTNNHDLPTTNFPSAETEYTITTQQPPLLKSRQVKITPIKQPPLSFEYPTTQKSTHSTLSSIWKAEHQPIPPPPTFDLNDPSVSLDPDGVYHFKYSVNDSLALKNLPSSRNNSSEEEYYDITTPVEDSYSYNPYTFENFSSLQDDETTLKIPSTIDKVTTQNPPIPTTFIDGSEEEEITKVQPSSYRNYFSGEEVIPNVQGNDPPIIEKKQGLFVKQITEVTVTVTVTEKTNLSLIIDSDYNHNVSERTNKSEENNRNEQNLMNFVVLPTPILPDMISSVKVIPESSRIIESDDGNGIIHIFPTIVSTNHSTLTERVENDGKIEENNPISVTSLVPSIWEIGYSTQTPLLTTSKEFKSIFYATEERPFYSSSTYSFTSSTEFSFFLPEDEDHHHHHFHGGENHHDHQPDEDHQHHHQPIDEEEDKELPSIQPSTSSIYNSNSSGFKTPVVNESDQSFLLPPSHPPITTTIPISVEEDTRKSSLITIHESDELPKYLLGSSPQPLEVLSETTREPSHGGIEVTTNNISHEIEDNKTSAEDDNEKEDSRRHETHFPPVAVYIQILLDMSPVQFCPSIVSFKEMIILVYQHNQRDVRIDQIVLHSDPRCLPPPAKFKPFGGKGQTSSPATNNAQVTLKNKKDEDGNEKINKTRRGNISESSETIIESGSTMMSMTSSFYPVYIYLNDKNGTYDQFLTESFIDLWNMTKLQEGLFFNRIKRVEMIISSEGITGHAPSNENTGVIAAISVASIAVVGLLLLGVLLLVMRHRQAQTTFAKRCTPVTLDDYSLDNISVFNSFRRKQRNRASKRSYTNAGFDDPDAPTKILDIEGLTTAVKEVSQIYEEFGHIPNVNPTLDDIPNGAESKNRYANVIPMPDTRVLLTFQDDLPNSDYINANFIQGGNGVNKAYIITQGPLEETIVDFWRMVWEQQVRVIFMLTDFSEGGIPKCGEYYPRSDTIDCSQLHGDFQITLEKRDIAEHCITSFLVIKEMARSLRRDVVHLWYHSWPEKGIPENPKMTVDFLIKSRKYTKETCPVLVHCSPGTGRSGTIVACDIGLKELDSQRKVDIPQIVKRVRHDRAGAVQTKDQYRHIYDVIQNFGTKSLGSTTLPEIPSI